MFVVVSVILFASCNTNELDFDNVRIEPITGRYSFPLGEVRYVMRELIEKQEDENLDLQEDSTTSLLFLLYQESFDYQVQDDFISIGDVMHPDTVDLTATGAVLPVNGPATVPISQTFSFPYEPKGDEIIDSVFHTIGDVMIDVTTNLDGILDYTFTANNTVTVVNESPLQITSAGSNSKSLLNHKTLLNEATANTLTLDFDAILTLGAGQSFVGTESLTFEITYFDQSFSFIYGKFGQDTVQIGRETLDIDFFENSSGEGIFFGNPRMTFDFHNSFGIPFGLDFSTIFGDNGAGTTQTFLSGDIIEKIPVVNSGDFNNPGGLVQTILEANSGNSTLVDVLATSPSRLGFDVTAISNPYDANASNFLVPESKVSAAIDVEIPMEIRLENFEQSGTLSLGDGLDIRNVDSVFMRVATFNELPFTGLLALEIQDVDSNALYTVTDKLGFKGSIY